MPSIAEQLQSAVQDFADFNKKMIGPEAMGGAMRQFELMLKNNAGMLEDLNKSGELTEDAFKALDKQIEKTRVKGFGALEKDTFRKHFKVMKEASKAMSGFTGGLKDSIRSITRFIPLVGEKIAKSFDKVIDKKIAPRLNKAFMVIFGKKGGKKSGMMGGLSLGKMGLWGSAALAIVGIIKALNLAEKQLVSIVKETGFLRKDVRKLVKETNDYQRALLASGATLEGITNTQIALIKQFGQIKQVTGEMVNTAKMLELALGIGTDEAASMMETMTRGWKATNKEIEFFTANVAANANIHGVSFSLVMREITKDANLLASYTKETSHRLAETAIQSQILGLNLSDIVSFGDSFLDFSVASEKTMKMRMLIGTTMNAQEAISLANLGDHANMQRIIGKQMVASGKWEKLSYGFKVKTAQELGTTVEYLNKTVEIGKMSDIQFKNKLADMEALYKRTQDNRDIWDKMIGNIKAVFLPLLKDVGEYMEIHLSPLVNKITAKLQEWFTPTKGTKPWVAFKEGFAKVFDWMGVQLVKVINFALDNAWPTIATGFNTTVDYAAKAFSKIINAALTRISSTTLGSLFVDAPGGSPDPGWYSRLSSPDPVLSAPTPGKYSQVQGVPELSSGIPELQRRRASGFGSGSPGFGNTKKKPKSNGFINDFAEWTPITDSLSWFGRQATSFAKGVTGFAKGGIVTKPTKALIGEAGPEMVIPLDGKGLDYSKGGGFKFTRGAFIAPMSTQGGIADVGSSMASGDPIARLERRKVAQDYGKTQAKQRKELVEYWKKEEEERRKKKKDYRTFSSGVSRFGKFGDDFKNSFGKSFTTLLANRIGEAFGLLGVGDVIDDFQDARRENSVSAWAKFGASAAQSLGYSGLATSITQGANLYNEGKNLYRNIKSGNVAGAAANVVAGRNSLNQFMKSGIFRRDAAPTMTLNRATELGFKPSLNAGAGSGGKFSLYDGGALYGGDGALSGTGFGPPGGFNAPAFGQGWMSKPGSVGFGSGSSGLFGSGSSGFGSGFNASALTKPAFNATAATSSGFGFGSSGFGSGSSGLGSGSYGLGSGSSGFGSGSSGFGSGFKPSASSPLNEAYSSGMGGLGQTESSGVFGGARKAFGSAKAGFKAVGTKAKNVGKVFTGAFKKGGTFGGIGERLGKIKIPGLSKLAGKIKIPGGMGGVMMGVGALSSIMQGDYKGAAVGLAKGIAAKAIYGIPGIGQVAMLGDLMGLGVTDKAFSIVSGSIGGSIKAFTGGVKDMGSGVKKLFSGDIKGGIKSIGKGIYGTTVGTAIGGIKGSAGAVGRMFGLGKKATIETSWHPALLAHLFANRYKLRDKVKKSEIKRINQSLGFAGGYVPGSKDGFSKYNVKGGEEKEEKQMARTANWKDWALQRSAQIWGVPAMAAGGIVSRPTLAVVGESGPEAVVPLGGGGSNDLLGAINGLRKDIQALANRPIVMDGRRVSAVVSENFFEMAQQ